MCRLLHTKQPQKLCLHFNNFICQTLLGIDPFGVDFIMWSIERQDSRPKDFEHIKSMVTRNSNSICSKPSNHWTMHSLLFKQTSKTSCIMETLDKIISSFYINWFYCKQYIQRIIAFPEHCCLYSFILTAKILVLQWRNIVSCHRI